MFDSIKDILITAGALVGGGTFGSFLTMKATRRKSSAEADSVVLDNMKKIYEQRDKNYDELRQRLDEDKQERIKEKEEYTKEIEYLKLQVKQIYETYLNEAESVSEKMMIIRHYKLCPHPESYLDCPVAAKEKEVDDRKTTQIREEHALKYAEYVNS